eukprot:gene25335-10992_t
MAGLVEDGVPRRDEFVQLDERPIQSLSAILSLDDLRRQQAQETVAKEGFRPGGFLPKISQQQKQTKQSGHNLGQACQAAKSQLEQEKPEIIEKMDKAISQCDVAKQNRSYRLNSLGVFESDVNEARANSMHRVELHKGLSTTSMRLTNSTTKDVKLTVPDESVAGRIEKMYNRVLKSIDETAFPRLQRGAGASLSLASPTSPTGRGGLSPVRSTAQFSAASKDGPGLNSRRLDLSRASGKELPSMGSRKWLDHQASIKSVGIFSSFKKSGRSDKRRTAFQQNSVSFMHRGGAGTPSSAKAMDWSRLSLPPEVAVAQAQHIATLTELHQDMYHNAVLKAQTAQVAKMGLAGLNMNMTVEEMEEFLEERKFDINDPNIKEVSKMIIAPTSINDMLHAAVEHAEIMAEELDDERSSPERLQDFKRRLEAAADTNTYVLSEDGGPMDPRPASTGTDAPYLADASVVEAEAEAEAGADVQKTASKSQPNPQGSGFRIPPIIGVNTKLFNDQRMKLYLQRTATGVKAVAQPYFNLPRLKLLPEIADVETESKKLQARLERLWSLLSIPLTKRLDMVLVYTQKNRSNQFEAAVGLMELASAVYLHREEQLLAVKVLKFNMEGGFIGQISIMEVERLAINLQQSTTYLIKICDKLRDEFGATFQVSGKDYPGPHTDQADMLEFMHCRMDDAESESLLKLLSSGDLELCFPPVDDVEVPPLRMHGAYLRLASPDVFEPLLNASSDLTTLTVQGDERESWLMALRYLLAGVLPKREFDFRNVLKALPVVHKYNFHALLKEMVEWLSRSSNDDSEDEQVEDKYEDEDEEELATYYKNELSYFLGVDEKDPGSYALTWLRMTEKLQLEDLHIICVRFIERALTKLLKQGGVL